MAEVYPSDNELLNIQSDSETGVEYIATGACRRSSTAVYCEGQFEQRGGKLDRRKT